MKKYLLAAVLVMGMVSVAQAEMRNAESDIKSSESEACANAKQDAKNRISENETIADFKKCECSPAKNAFGPGVKCNVDYKVEKKR